ncbi:MAG: Gfo/Idh/MocA family oxidoreductase [Microbacterium sp.]
MAVRLGMMSYAHVHAPMYLRHFAQMADVEMVGVYEPDPERAAEASAFGIPVFDRAEDLFEAAPDGIVVESENTRHREDVVAASALGVPILCEKPMAATGDDAAEMARICDERSTALMVAFPMRFSAPLLAVREAVRDGRLGRVIAAEGVNQGQLPKHRRNWFVDPALSGGGAVMDHTVHVADALRWILDDEVVEVYAQANDIVARGEVEVETSGIVSLRFGRGAIATVDCSWNRPKTYPAWGGLGIRLVGSGGTVDADAYARKITRYDDAAGRYSTVDCSDDAYGSMLRHFVQVVRGDAAPTPAGRDGVKAAEIVDAAYRSIASGASVALTGDETTSG